MLRIQQRLLSIWEFQHQSLSSKDGGHMPDAEKILRTLIRVWADQNNVEIEEIKITKKEEE